MQLNREISVGDSVGLAVRYCRRDFPLLFKMLLIPSAVELIGKFMLVVAARMFLDASRTGAGFPEPSAFILGFIGMCIGIPSQIWLTMRQLGYVRMLILAKENYDQCYKEVRGRWWYVLVFAVIFYIAFMVWVFAWVFLFAFFVLFAKLSPVIGLLLGPLCLLLIVLAFISLVLLLLPLCVLFAVVACEDSGFFSSLKRSFSMTFKRLPPSLGFCILSGLTNACLYFVLTAILQIIYMYFYIQTGGPAHAYMSEAKMPIYVQLLGSLWHSAVYMYLMPVHYLASGFFYYTLRMRMEGLDIVSGIKELERKRQALPG